MGLKCNLYYLYGNFCLRSCKGSASPAIVHKQTKNVLRTPELISAVDNLGKACIFIQTTYCQAIFLNFQWPREGTYFENILGKVRTFSRVIVSQISLDSTVLGYSGTVVSCVVPSMHSVSFFLRIP